MKRLPLTRLRPTTNFLWLLTVITGSAGLLLYKLYSLTPGLAASEIALPPFKESVSSIWNAPLELPILFSRAIVALVSPSTGAALSRLPSALVALVLIGAAYWIMKRWYGHRLAVFGTLLLATSPWLLHTGRLAVNDIVYPLAMMTLIAATAAWHQKQWRIRTLYVSAIVISLILYIPGVIWLLIAVATFERKNIISQIVQRKKHTVAAAMVGVITLIPLLHSLVINPALVSALAGLPSKLPMPLDIVTNIARTWQYIFIGGLNYPLRNLGSLPIITTFVALSFIIGIYIYSRHLKATRTKQLAGLWIIGSFLIALEGPVSLTLLLPLVHILAVGGIGYLLHVWLKTFPRNPYARSFGIVLIGIVVLFAVAYNLRSYYLAWPNTPAVRSTFTRQL